MNFSFNSKFQNYSEMCAAALPRFRRPSSRRRRHNGTGQEASSCRLRAAPGRGLSVSPRSRPRWPCSGTRPALQPSGPALLWSYHHQAARPAGPWRRHYWGRTWAATPRSGASAAPPRPLCQPTPAVQQNRCFTQIGAGTYPQYDHIPSISTV